MSTLIEIAIALLNKPDIVYWIWGMLLQISETLCHTKPALHENPRGKALTDNNFSKWCITVCRCFVFQFISSIKIETRILLLNFASLMCLTVACRYKTSQLNWTAKWQFRFNSVCKVTLFPSDNLVVMTMCLTFCCHIISQKSSSLTSVGPCDAMYLLSLS